MRMVATIGELIRDLPIACSQRERRMAQLDELARLTEDRPGRVVKFSVENPWWMRPMAKEMP